jgi:hypothetical protein
VFVGPAKGYSEIGSGRTEAMMGWPMIVMRRLMTANLIAGSG